MIRITSRVEGFRRCGVAHSKVATDHSDAAFSAADLKALLAEPLLTVEVIADEPKTGGKQADKTTGKKSEQADKTTGKKSEQADKTTGKKSEQGDKGE